ncbi:MAG: primosomal protein [SAR324 cluster bacterium]|jgi:tetratricopeptide (TPR) repeat protein|nr:primosomal protein [SAR324 cluster bacterium]MDP7614770.1 primosomal protein [SAR324 cluster bacterium]
MKNNKFFGAEVSLYSLLIICLLSFLFIDKLNAQESPATSDQAQVEDPSPEKAAESAEKKQTLEELLAVPFNQIKKEQEEEELALSGDGSVAKKLSGSNKGDVKLPPPPEQRRVERDIEKQLDVIFREKLPKEYVGVSVSIRYILETVPVTKRDKSISKIKLPGFENNVWVPTQTKKIVGIVNQVRPYTTIFAVVNTSISLFNVEVLRQTLDDRVKFLNLTGRDVLKMVHVPFTTPATSSVTTLDNAAVEFAEADNAETDNTEADADADTDTDNGSIIDEEPGVAGEQENLAAGEEKPEAILEPDPEPRRIDMKAKVETTRYLLQARKAYMSENYDSAITALRRAIELNPFSSQAFAMLGSIYYRLGWNRMALENWQHALKLDPTNEGLKKYLMRLSR